MSDAVERVEASWAGLIDVIEGIPAEQMSEPGVSGDWSIKDLLGHIAYWEGRAIAVVERRLTGEPDPPGSEQDFESLLRGDLS